MSILMCQMMMIYCRPRLTVTLTPVTNSMVIGISDDTSFDMISYKNISNVDVKVKLLISVNSDNSKREETRSVFQL